MNNSIICFVLAGFFCYACSGGKQTADKPAETQADYSLLSKAEKMALTDPDKQAPPSFVVNLSGDTLPLSQFSDKLLVIDFWATWCSPCIELIPEVHELAQEYENRNVEFITVSVDGDQTFWKQFVKEKEWEQNAYWIGENEQNPLFWYVYQTYATEFDSSVIIALPKFVLLSAEGVILKKDFMPPSHPAFKKMLEQHLDPI